MDHTYQDKKEIEQLVKRNKDTVFRLAYTYCGNRQDAEDIFQEVFLRFCKKKIVFHDMEHEKAWFIRVTINCCKSLLRSAWHRKVVPLEEEVELEQKEDYELLESVLMLPEKYKTVLYLYYYEGYPAAKLSSILHVNASTLRSRLDRGRKLLKESLEREERYGR